MGQLSATGGPVRFGWLFEVPPHSERTIRMEALIARLRLLLVLVNSIALAFLLDTHGMRVGAAWAAMGFAALYGIPVVIFEPYRRWRVFQTSLITAAADSIAIGALGASGEPAKI